jgi:hypothetical protein
MKLLKILSIFFLLINFLNAKKLEANLELVEKAFEKYSKLESIYQPSMNKFFFITVKIDKISLEYFQFLLEEFINSNSESSLCYINDSSSLILVTSSNIKLNDKILSSVFSEYIDKIYTKYS